MHKSRLAAFIFTSLLFAATASAQGLQIKGRSIGMTQAQACGDVEIQDIGANIEKAGVKGVSLPATGCDISIPSLGTVVLQSPAALLFWNNSLVRIIVKMDRLDMQATADVRSALVDLYGKPKTRRNKPFVIDVWQRKGQTLSAEWMWSDGEPVSGSLYLTDTQGYAQFSAAHDRAMKQIEAKESGRIKSDILN